jgi:hypothetical protein
MTWCEYLTVVYLLTGVVLAVYYTVHDVRQRCFPDDAILLIPLITVGWPYTVWVLARVALQERTRIKLTYMWVGDGTKNRNIKPEKRKGK